MATSSAAYADIAGQLAGFGLAEFRDFARLEDFFPEWFWKNRRQVCVLQIFSSVTSRCTFRCRHCNAFMPYVPDGRQYEHTAAEILADFDAFFRLADYVGSWSILGGEPLTNPRLADIIEAVHARHGGRIGYIEVISNGSLVPDGRLLAAMRRCHVTVRLSDYTHAIDYAQRLAETKAAFIQGGVPVEMSVYKQWTDIGLPREIAPLSDDPAEQRRHMLACSYGCHDLNGRRLWFCGPLFAATRCGLYEPQPGDTIDIEALPFGERRQVLEYCVGNPPRNSIGLCNHCYGVLSSDNRRFVPAAGQLE